MQLYSAKIRLGGSLQNEVRRNGLTAAEIGVLRKIHGEQFIVEIESEGLVSQNTDAQERARLTSAYGPKVVDEVLGTSVHALPKDVPGVTTKRASKKSQETRDPGVPPAPAQAETASLMG